MKVICVIRALLTPREASTSVPSVDKRRRAKRSKNAPTSDCAPAALVSDDASASLMSIKTTLLVVPASPADGAPATPTSTGTVVSVVAVLTMGRQRATDEPVVVFYVPMVSLPPCHKTRRRQEVHQPLSKVHQMTTLNTVKMIIYMQ